MRHLPNGRTLIILLTVSGIAGLSLLVLSPMATFANAGQAPENVALGPVKWIPFHRLGMAFRRQAAPNSVVSESAAIATAEKYEPATSTDGQLLPGVTVEASYGPWSSDQIATMDKDGNEVLTYQKVPAWIVSFSGLGFSVGPPTGESGHGESVVVDASTGQALISFQ